MKRALFIVVEGSDHALSLRSLKENGSRGGHPSINLLMAGFRPGEIVALMSCEEAAEKIIAGVDPADDHHRLIRSLLTSDGAGRHAKAEALEVLLRAVAGDPGLLTQMIEQIGKGAS